MENIDVKEVTNAWKSDKGFDPTGSYTGKTDKGDTPIQDADDL